MEARHPVFAPSAFPTSELHVSATTDPKSCHAENAQFKFEPWRFRRDARRERPFGSVDRQRGYLGSGPRPFWRFQGQSRLGPAVMAAGACNERGDQTV